MKKLNNFLKKNTVIFHEYVQSPEDIKITMLNYPQILRQLKFKNPIKYYQLKSQGFTCFIKISLHYQDSTIAATGSGPDVFSAFYQAKIRLHKVLNKLEQLAVQENNLTDAVDLNLKNLH